MYPSDLD